MTDKLQYKSNLALQLGWKHKPCSWKLQEKDASWIKVQVESKLESEQTWKAKIQVDVSSVQDKHASERCEMCKQIRKRKVWDVRTHSAWDLRQVQKTNKQVTLVSRLLVRYKTSIQDKEKRHERSEVKRCKTKPSWTWQTSSKDCVRVHVLVDCKVQDRHARQRCAYESTEFERCKSKLQKHARQVELKSWVWNISVAGKRLKGEWKKILGGASRTNIQISQITLSIIHQKRKINLIQSWKVSKLAVESKE